MNGLRKGGKRSFRKMLNSTNEKGRGGAIKHIGFYSGIIETVGYDPQCAILEIRLCGGTAMCRRMPGTVSERATIRILIIADISADIIKNMWFQKAIHDVALGRGRAGKRFRFPA